MLEIIIKEMSNDTVEVVISNGQHEFVIKDMSEVDCLNLSTILMDAAEDLLKMVNPSLTEILGSVDPDKSGNMIN